MYNRNATSAHARLFVDKEYLHGINIFPLQIPNIIVYKHPTWTLTIQHITGYLHNKNALVNLPIKLYNITQTKPKSAPATSRKYQNQDEKHS